MNRPNENALRRLDRELPAEAQDWNNMLSANDGRVDQGISYRLFLEHSDAPFVSVLIPALNEEGRIEACLQSILVQTYPRGRFEIVVGDNGSNDDTVKIALRYADQVLVRPNLNVSERET